jgi:hypothetical protein
LLAVRSPCNHLLRASKVESVNKRKGQANTRTQPCPPMDHLITKFAGSDSHTLCRVLISDGLGRAGNCSSSSIGVRLLYMNRQNDKAWKAVKRFVTSSVVIRSKSGANKGKAGTMHCRSFVHIRISRLYNQEMAYIIITQHVSHTGNVEFEWI